ncbi:MAG: hypothetical protein ACI93R_003376 [Flavobacteriales bacterium]|jgi:uncharacterized protein (DUF2062 family)
MLLMPKKLFKRWSPDPEKLRSNPAFKFLGVVLHDPYLFHLNRHSISAAFFVGLFVAFLPIPGQIPLAAALALLFRCNLPISVTLIWISNPITFPIIFYGTYKIGARILDIPESGFSFAISWEWLKLVFPTIWAPLLLGSLLASLFFSCTGYLAVQWSWRWHIARKWRARQEERKKHHS